MRRISEIQLGAVQAGVPDVAAEAFEINSPGIAGHGLFTCVVLRQQETGLRVGIEQARMRTLDAPGVGGSDKAPLPAEPRYLIIA